MLVEPNDHTDWPSRVEVLLQLVESEADSRLANGTPGAWGDVTRRCRSAGEALRAETACDVQWHIYWLELSLWGDVFQRFLLPERQDQLLEALEVAANRATPEDPQAWDALLSLIHPGLGDPAADVHLNTFIRIEVRFYRTLRAFRADPSVSSLRACLAIVLELLRAVERQTSHRSCGPDTYLAGDVVSEALTGLLPLAHRWVLTRVVEVLFFRLYGEGDEATVSGSVPHALWRRLPKGQVVASVTLRLAGPTPRHRAFRRRALVRGGDRGTRHAVQRVVVGRPAVAVAPAGESRARGGGVAGRVVGGRAAREFPPVGDRRILLRPVTRGAGMSRTPSGEEATSRSRASGDPSIAQNHRSQEADITRSSRRRPPK